MSTLRMCFSGKMGAGKTDAAKRALETAERLSGQPARRISFARPVKQIGDLREEKHPHVRFQRLVAMAREFAPDLSSDEHVSLATSWARDIEESKDLRELYQRIGTESGRAHKQDIWVDYAYRTHKDLFDSDAPLVVDDFRFVNEAEFMKAKGFLPVRIWVPEEIRLARIEGRVDDFGLGIPGHASEHDLDDYPLPVFDNSGSRENLLNFVDNILYGLMKDAVSLNAKGDRIDVDMFKLAHAKMGDEGYLVDGRFVFDDTGHAVRHGGANG
jgi:hypothetical protein